MRTAGEELMNDLADWEMEDKCRKVRRKKTLVWILGVLLLLASAAIFLFTPWWRQLVNPWTETDLTFCSPKYHVCIADEPKWTVQIPIRDIFRPDEAIIRFLILNFETERLDADADIMVLPPVRLDLFPMDIVQPIDYLSLLLERFKKEKNNFRMREPPTTVKINTREAALAVCSLKNNEMKEVEGEVYVLIAGNLLYQIIYRAPSTQFERYRAEARSIIQSFTAHF